MPAYTKVQTTFRLNPWHGVKGSSSNIFKTDTVNQELTNVLEYIIQELYEAGYPRVKSGAFSIINIFNPDTRNSVGFSEEPHSDLIKPMAGLVLTFSLSSRPLAKTPKDVHQNGITNFTVFWGTSQIKATDNLTVSVPKEILKNEKISFGMVDDLLLLYNIIGIVTKNFVLNEFNPKYTRKFNIPNIPEGILKSKYLELPLPSLFKYSHPMYWPFNLNFWNNSSQLLMPRHFSPKLNLYFCVYILDMLGPNLSKIGYDYVYGVGPNSLTVFLNEGIRKIFSIVKNKNLPGSIENSVYGSMHLLYSMYEPGGIGRVDDYATYTRIMNGIIDRLSNDYDLEIEFNQLFSSSRKLVYLILNDDNSLKSFLRRLF
jgi:hypothetical protein